MRKPVFSSALLALCVAACSGDKQQPDSLLAPRVMHAIGTDPVSGATIQTNLDDYYPGQVVHLTGRGWAANETIRLIMTEEPEAHEDVTMDVVADADGAFAVDFYHVQVHDIGVTFTLTATGLSSGSVATAVFYDGNISLHTNNAAITISVPWRKFNHNATCSGDGNDSGTKTGVSNVALPISGVNDGQSLRVTAPDVTGYNFVNWSLDGATPAVTKATAEACLPGSSANQVWTANYTPAVVSNNPPTAVPGGDYAGDEGESIELTGTGSTDSDGIIVSYTWSYSITSVDTGADCEITNGDAVVASIVCNDDGTYAITLKVTDDDGDSHEATTTLELSNVAPVVVIDPDSRTIDEGGTASYTAMVTDQGSNDGVDSFAWTTTVGACTLESGSTATSATFSCNDNGTGSIKLEVTDDDEGTGSDEAGLTANNVDPTATFAAPGSVNEGSSINLSLTSVVDPGTADTHTYQFDCGSGYGTPSTTATASCPTTDNGTRTVKGKVIDDDGGFTVYHGTVTINNVAPTISLVTGPLSPIQLVGGSATAPITITFSDPALSNDTYSASVVCGNGTTVGPSTVTSPATVTCTYAGAGVYTLSATISDEDGGLSPAVEYSYVVIFDPSAGFVTGGGWIQSQQIFCKNAGLCPNASGKGSFGFVSKYLKGATVPTGNTEFQLQAGDFNFKSSSYEWLVVNQNGTNAQFKGIGTINGSGSYKFTIRANDKVPDEFDIRIWEEINGEELDVYLTGGLILLNNVTGNGSIQIHVPKK